MSTGSFPLGLPLLAGVRSVLLALVLPVFPVVGAIVDIVLASAKGAQSVTIPISLTEVKPWSRVYLLVEARKSITGVITNINKLMKIMYDPDLNTKLSTKLLSNEILFCLYRTFVVLESRTIESQTIESDSMSWGSINRDFIT